MFPSRRGVTTPPKTKLEPPQFDALKRPVACLHDGGTGRRRQVVLEIRAELNSNVVLLYMYVAHMCNTCAFVCYLALRMSAKHVQL